MATHKDVLTWGVVTWCFEYSDDDYFVCSLHHNKKKVFCFLTFLVGVFKDHMKKIWVGSVFLGCPPMTTLCLCISCVLLFIPPNMSNISNPHIHTLECTKALRLDPDKHHPNVWLWQMVPNMGYQQMPLKVGLRQITHVHLASGIG